MFTAKISYSFTLLKMNEIIQFPVKIQGTDTLENQVDYSISDNMCHYSEREFRLHIIKSDGKCFDGTHNISQIFVCFTPVLLVWLQFYIWWGAWCIWIIPSCLLKPHGITPLIKPMSNFSITLFRNCCKFSCVKHKVYCSELSLCYDYSMNNFCDITIIRYLN